jgi:hypothetical protein
MRTRACAIALLLGAAARAQDDDLFREYRKLASYIEAAKEFTGTDRFDESDLKSFLANYAGFEGLGTISGADEERFYKEDKYRFDLVLEHKPFLDWAKERGLDAKPWLRKATRIMVLRTKEVMEPAIAVGLEGLAAQAMELEKERGALKEEQYKKAKAKLDGFSEAVKHLSDAFKALPAPTEEEAKLLVKYKKEIARSFLADYVDKEEEGGCGEEEEGDGGK